jgi:hypothetical protein
MAGMRSGFYRLKPHDNHAAPAFARGIILPEGLT